MRITSSNMYFTAVLCFLCYHHAAQVLWLKQNLPFVDPWAAAHLRLPLNPQGFEPLLARGGSKLILHLCCRLLWLWQQARKGTSQPASPLRAAARRVGAPNRNHVGLWGWRGKRRTCVPAASAASCLVTSHPVLSTIETSALCFCS